MVELLILYNERTIHIRKRYFQWNHGTYHSNTEWRMRRQHDLSIWSTKQAIYHHIRKKYVVNAVTIRHSRYHPTITKRKHMWNESIIAVQNDVSEDFFVSLLLIRYMHSHWFRIWIKFWTLRMGTKLKPVPPPNERVCEAKHQKFIVQLKILILRIQHQTKIVHDSHSIQLMDIFVEFDWLSISKTFRLLWNQ